MLDWTIELAYRAGALLRAGLERDREIALKSRAEVVTDVDRASEALIVAAIRAQFPDHRVVAEEGGGAAGSSAYTWLVDPLDGTNNYAHGFPFFCVSLGLLQNDQPLLGVVYDPLRDELFTAERGAGARCNGRRLEVSSVARLDAALLTTGFPYNRFSDGDNNLREFGQLLLRAQDVRRPGSAALDLVYVAAGRSEGHWELGLHPWDVAAGALLVTEAGGRITGWQGQPWSPWDARMVATNGSALHTELLEALNEP
ncbi:MAG: inositol monophosphatase [Chloroflexales bacterium]|nr:inositol monophosphatase [Chloroflexales bacterium]